MAEERIPFMTHGFSLVVVRNFDGRWLAIKETRNRGWWLPAGLVDPGETFMQAAHREVKEEAGLSVEMKGILRVEHSVYNSTNARMRVVFFAIPTDPSVLPKTFPDKESEEARWVSLEDIKKLSKQPPGLRGPELYEWGNYIEKGGMIAPLHFLCREDAPTPSPQPSFIRLQEPTNAQPDLPSLIQALENGKEELLRKAVLVGGEINLIINDKLWTLLHLACRLDLTDAVFYLLNAGADLNASTHKGRNAMHFAAQCKNELLCVVLLWSARSGTDIVNVQDRHGDTPLHFAASLGRTDNWDSLVKFGADPNLRNSKGLCPGDFM